MAERCPKCKRPIWDGGHALNPRECSGDTFSREICDTHAALVAAQSELAELRRETEAWRVLAERRALLHRGDTGYWLEVYNRPATIEGYPAIGDAAIAAARQLGLLKETKSDAD